MAMRRKPAATVKVRKAWRCPNCGRKVDTAECYGCLIEAEREQKAKRNRDAALILERMVGK